MECEENGAVESTVAGHRGVKRKRGGGGARCVQLARAPALPRSPGRRPLPVPAQASRAPTPPRAPPRCPVYRSPFLNVKLMEEITFWVCTRRAPCLYGYNNVYKKKMEEAHCSKYRNSSEPSSVEEVPSPKKKRKLRLLDDESVSSEKQQNIYFERHHKQYRSSWYSSDKSESDRSDVDFNIRNSSVRNKSKAFKRQRRNRSTAHKKNKILTSTPKATTLRRSLRKTPQNYHSHQMDCSLMVFESEAVNGEHKAPSVDNSNGRNKCTNHNTHGKGNTVLKEQSKNEIVPNGQFEDMSDVSGFTANYIRSTKLNSKTPRKVRSKPGRNLARESQQKLHKDESKIIVCVNKSANTDLPTPILNHSTDSSRNVINLVSVNNNNNEKSVKIDQSTSQLKFMDSNNEPVKAPDKDETHNVNVSFQSKSSGVSRYPTRHRNHSTGLGRDLENNHKSSASAKKRPSRGMRELRSINRNEEPICLVSRTRSGKQIGVMLTDPEESGRSEVRADDAADEVSGSVIRDAAGSSGRCERKKRASRSKKSDGRKRRARKDSDGDSDKKNVVSDGSSSPAKGGAPAPRKESLRDRSGFAACFSDSEEDKPLLRRKFFC